MTQILALTPEQYYWIKSYLSENAIQLEDTGKYILTSITLNDSVDMLRLFQAGIMHGLNIADETQIHN